MSELARCNSGNRAAGEQRHCGARWRAEGAPNCAGAVVGTDVVGVGLAVGFAGLGVGLLGLVGFVLVGFVGFVGLPPLCAGAAGLAPLCAGAVGGLLPLWAGAAGFGLEPLWTAHV